MIRSSASVVWARVVLVILFAAATSTAAIAQKAVEIEIAGPWSYVPDLTDSGRIIIVAPKGHTMAVFTGDDVSGYSGIAVQPLGPHRLDFEGISCGPSPASSSYFLYPVDGVGRQKIQNTVSSASSYSISLPKPCSYDSQNESVFKYHGRRPITPSDRERSFTTSMTLHYEVAATTTAAVLDNVTGKPILFDSNSGTTKKAISIVLYQDDDPDTDCDSHSATAFDSTLALWGVSHVYRIFPQLSYTPGTNYNQQIPGSYAPSCSQTFEGSLKAMASSSHPKVTHAKKNVIAAKEWPKSPGRADCHAAQINVNGTVN
jgi:hypothetical protein